MEAEMQTYNLVLNRHDAEIDNLHCWPNHEVGFQSRDIDVLELALHGALSTTLSNRHESKEAGETSRSKQELIKSDALECRQPGRSLCNWKRGRQKPEPSVLDGRH